MIVARLSKEDAIQYWPNVEDYIHKACVRDGNKRKVNNYFEAIKQETKQLWVVGDGQELVGVVITCLIQFPLKRACSIEICTGKRLSEWVDYAAIIETWAKSMNCDQMLLTCRAGFEKKLPTYRKTHIYLEKDL